MYVFIKRNSLQYLILNGLEKCDQLTTLKDNNRKSSCTKEFFSRKKKWSYTDNF